MTATGWAETRLRAMGGDAHVLACGGDERLLRAALGRAATRVCALERLWSRFEAASDVSALNRAGGRPVAVSPETVALVSAAVEGYWRTAGRFDPTVLGDVVRAGYDRDLAAIGVAGSRPAPGAGRAARLRRGCAGLAVDAVAGTVTLPPGVGFDPGGIAKGLAADWLCAALLAEGASGACANLGGDLRVAGEAPGGGPWAIGVEGPERDTPRPIAVIERRDGGIATSTVARRRWATPTGDGHHLVDPRTAAPSGGDVVAVTVAAATACDAEVLATAAIVAGLRVGQALVAQAGAGGLFVDTAGRIHRCGSLEGTPGLPDVSAPPALVHETRAAALAGRPPPSLLW